MDNFEYTLHLNNDQAREVFKAVELLMRLKINQPHEIPRALIPLEDDEFCEKRDMANEHLDKAFKAIFPTIESCTKDDEWYRLYNLYQVLRYAFYQASGRTSWGVDSDPPRRFTDEPLPKIEFRKV